MYDAYMGVDGRIIANRDIDAGELVCVHIGSVIANCMVDCKSVDKHKYVGKLGSDKKERIDMDTNVKERIERGLRMAELGRIGEGQKVVCYRVRGDTDYYTVTKHNDGEWTCTCPDFVHRGNKCKHIWGTIFREEGI